MSEAADYENSRMYTEGAKDARATAPVKGKLIEMGDLKSADSDGSVHDYPKSILVQFDSVADIRRALDEGICKFVWP